MNRHAVCNAWTKKLVEVRQSGLRPPSPASGGAPEAWLCPPGVEELEELEEPGRV